MRIRVISWVASALTASLLVVASPAFATPPVQHLTLASPRAILASGNGPANVMNPGSGNGQHNGPWIILGPQEG
jgi:hypothetical protein